jgi:hypothetical protein
MPSESPRLRALRMLLMMDATVLILLGVALVFAPRSIEHAFHFPNLPAGVSYLVGLWGATMATLGVGYAMVASDPARSGVWVCMGIARGIAECIVGAVCVLRGIVTWDQAGFGTIIAGFIALAYAMLHPRKEAV